MTVSALRWRPTWGTVMRLLAVVASTSVPVAAAAQDRPDPRTSTTDRRIFFAENPALLIVVNGDPVYRRLPGTHLERITNTKAFIVRDGAGIHYLKVLDGWMEAYGLHGMWTVAGVPPPDVDPALGRLAAARRIDLLVPSGTRDNRTHLDDATAPTIFISTTPADLIVTDGPARYATVEGTALEYVENTTANVFKEPTDDELYVRLAGRWFRAWTTDGPWQFVPRSKLPADIAGIPGDSVVWRDRSPNGGTKPSR